MMKNKPLLLIPMIFMISMAGCDQETKNGPGGIKAPQQPNSQKPIQKQSNKGPQNTPVTRPNQKPAGPRKIFNQTKSKSNSTIANAYKKSVTVMDMQRMRELTRMALQYQLIKGQWPESQEAFEREFPSVKTLLKGNGQGGVKRQADLMYLAPTSTHGRAKAIIFVMDESGQPMMSEMQGFTDGSISKP